MEKHLPTFIKSIVAGVIVTIAAGQYLIMDNKYIGAVAFTIGLFSIYTLGLSLFTGKIGFLLQDKDIMSVAVVWIGNLVGTVLSAKMFLYTRLVETSTLVSKAVSSSTVKLSDGLVSVFILAIGCGILMYVGAYSYKKTQNTANSFGGYFGMTLCVIVFVLFGFEHSIANMVYFTFADMWSVSAILPLIVATLGNAVGGLFIPFCTGLCDKIEAKNTTNV